jgi:hypothetical protein
VKRLIYCAIVCAIVIAVVAGLATAQPSPADQTSVRVDGKAITIKYSAPSVKGRQIFGDGGLISGDPNYPVWRAGAKADAELGEARGVGDDRGEVGFSLPRSHEDRTAKDTEGSLCAWLFHLRAFVVK